MNKNELLNVVGGASVSSAVISAVTKAVTTIYEYARRFGSAVIRTKTGNLCM